MRLVRSKAVCDDVSSSPPPDIHIYQDSTQTAPSNTTLMLSPNIAVSDILHAKSVVVLPSATEKTDLR